MGNRIVRLIKAAAGAMMMIMLCSGFVAVGQGYKMYQEAVGEVSLTDRVEDIRTQECYTEYEELPEDYVDAVVAVEDKRFFRHGGVDPIAVCRAVINDLKAGAFVEGGSTITQQLAKNLYFSQDKELTRKVAEVFMALALEREYSKEDIFELYVNSIYFGDGYYDVGSACEGYFGKETEDMSRYECTLLAGIPNAPSKYAPTKNPDLAAQRQLPVVRRLNACGYISDEEAETVAETVAETLAALAAN